MFRITDKIYEKAIELDSDIYHFHDPELLIVGLKLIRQGKKVIYDVHEDLPKLILEKTYLPHWFLPILSKTLDIYEIYAAKKFNSVLAATPSIQQRFVSKGIICHNINNYPLIGELDSGTVNKEKYYDICYIGDITRVRGIVELVKALEFIDERTRLQLGGPLNEPGLLDELQSLKGWEKVDMLGFLTREQVKEVFSKSIAGIVTFLPLPNHIEAQPNKMFEYMSAELPLIGANFPLWKEIIEGNNCGFCVDSLQPKTIADAINTLVDKTDLAQKMGQEGKKAVLSQYNWDIEQKKLLQVYEELT
jgi:glycosyltransferase involved in cell wall biosynthesis